MFNPIRKYAVMVLSSVLLVGFGVHAQIDINVPAEGTVSPYQNQFISGHAPAGWRIRLDINNTPVDSQLVRPDGVFEFIGVHTPFGPVTYSIVTEGTGKVFRAERHIHIVGPPDSIIIDIPSDIPADGRTVIHGKAAVVDQWGVKIPSGYPVTLRVDTLGILTPDNDPATPGIQLPLNDGEVNFDLQATRDAGTYILTLSTNGISVNKPVVLVTALEPLMLVGSANASGSFLNTKGDLSQLSDSGKFSSGLHSDGRLAFYGRGAIFDKYMLTASYDNQRHQDRFYQDLDPDVLYSIYGDNSNVDYTAQTSSPFFVKIERNRSNLYYGDFNTGLGHNELARYDRTFTGLKGHYEDSTQNADVFATLTNRKVTQDEIRGEGISGFYFLKNSNIVTGSEKVRIETRDAYHSDVIINRTYKSRFNDYEIDYQQGTLFFKQPVQSIDAAGNPVYIVVTYEAQSGSPSNYVFGGQGEKEVFKGLTAGATAVTEERDPANYTLYGFNTRYVMNSFVQATGQIAHGADVNSKGNAWRLDVSTTPLDKLSLKTYYHRVESGFVNQTLGGGGTGEIGSNKYGVSGSYSGMANTSLGAEYYRSTQNASRGIVTINSTTGTVEHSFGELAKGALKVENVRYESLSNDSTAVPDVRQSTILGANTSFKPMEKLTLTGQYERSIATSQSEVKPAVGSVGASYNVFKPVVLTAQYKFYETGGNATLFGVSSNVGYGTTVTGRYELGNGISGRRNQASIGLKNTTKITNDLTADVGYERTRALDRSLIEATTSDHDAFSLGLEFIPKEPYKAAFKGEYEKDAQSVKRNLTFGGDVNVSSGFTLIEKMSYYDEVRDQSLTSSDQFWSAPLALSQSASVASSGFLKRFRNTVGFAFRPVQYDWLNAIGKFDQKVEYNGFVSPQSDYSASIISLHTFVEPIPYLELGIKYALKYANEQSYGLRAKTLTDFYLARADYDLGWHNVDVAGEFRILSQREANDMRIGYSGEVGYVLMQNVRLGAGYNFVGSKDRDLVDYTYWSRGPYLTVKMKFTEKILNYFE
ncbi:MAG: hypothetical protein KGJ59_04295 [Bacteroidota bacterium]|nr:hypothetical protein [Bacteroidota bacterium]